MKPFTRTFDSNAAALAFPLGGIGTGNVSLGARGDLRDWEIFNRPQKNFRLPNTFFALRTQTPGGTPVTRVLEGPLAPPHTLSHGYHPSSNAGLPRMKQSTFRGEYPFAEIDFTEPSLPVTVHLEAYTPLIPLNPDDSGLPVAILTYTLTNTGAEPVNLTLVGSLANPVGGIQFDAFGNLVAGANAAGESVNAYRDENGLRGLHYTSKALEPGDLRFGSVSLVTEHASVTFKRHWLRGGWWDYLQEFWDDLHDDGLLNDLGYEEPSKPGQIDTGSLGLIDTLAPGESRKYRFFLTWNFPNRPNQWNYSETPESIARNHYAATFADSWAVAGYTAQNLSRLESETRTFHDALFDSTLAPSVLETLSANIVPIRSTTCFWLEDGRFFGWEGCFDNSGCCEGSCTHVWSYAHTLAFLFPTLEQEMRRIEFVTETQPDGFMHFRNHIPLELASTANRFHAAADGQMGSVLRVYREWLLSGDSAFLAEMWSGIKKSMAYAETQWDKDGDGLLEAQQHNTYDIEFYGPNPLCAFYYLAALRAVAQMAEALNESELAQRCQERFAQGSQKADAAMWNGEFYVQRLEDVDAYRYQHGLGCLSDQLLGQLHARLLGLGDLAPAEHIKAAVKAIFERNFRRDFHDHINCQRTYVLEEEAGLLLCTWPHGGRPKFPFPYSDEVWTGFEYQVAAHLIYEGWTAEGMEIVEAIRGRHDGIKRNPWNEVECGNHYARSMSSWALLTALSGVHTDLPKNRMTFSPMPEASTAEGGFQCYWSNGRGWGTYTEQQNPQTGEWTPRVEVLYGDLSGVTVQARGQEWTL